MPMRVWVHLVLQRIIAALGLHTGRRSGARKLALALAVLLSWGTASCEQRQTASWREEVLLHDGTTMTVKRSISTGHGPFEPGAHMAGLGDFALDFVAPDGRQIHWEDPGHQHPVLLDFRGGVPYLATSPALGGDYERFGCPFPAYVFYLYHQTDWVPIAFDTFPKEFRKANLSPAIKHRAALIARGFITAKEIDALLNEPGVSRGVTVIDPQLRSPCDGLDMRKKNKK